jgi:hypothetical protein
MKTGGTIALCFALAWISPVRADEIIPSDPVANGYARQIVETVLPPERGTDMMTEMMRAVQDQARDAILRQFNDPGIRQIVDSYFTKAPDRLRPLLSRYLPAITAAMTQAYTREFSPDELRQIADFAKSPAGRRYLSHNSAMMSDPSVAQANRDFFQEAREASRQSEGELLTAIEDYLLKHPDVARKIAQDRKARDLRP